MTWVEIIGFITGIIGVYLTMKENVWCFPIGLVNVILSLYLFYFQHLYADALQQIVYIILLSYGWIKWWRGDQGSLHLKISKSNPRLMYACLFSGIVFTLLLGSLLHHFTNASFPWIDSAATSAAFIAQYLIARKKIENWLVWIGVNITYIGIYLYKDLHLYAILFFVYLVFSFWGFAAWRKQYEAHEASV
ncbi:nicotinamide riboside transporter PnuC [soil metagenome]